MKLAKVNDPSSRSERQHYGASSPPIYQTATFAGVPGEEGPYDYSRSGNPSRNAVEDAYAKLESARHALAFGSGMAAIRAILDTVPIGGRVVAATQLYGGTARLLGHRAERGEFDLTLVDATRPEEVKAALGKKAHLLFLESPSNPGLGILELRTLSEIGRLAGALVVVDGSLLPPPYQRPLGLGADVVIHSATKFLAGHADLTAGVVATQDDAIAEKLAFIRNAEGTALAPFESWLLQRGMETLKIRFAQQSQTALKLAVWLRNRDELKSIHFPGLPDDPGHEIQAAQSGSFGSVFSLELSDDLSPIGFLKALQVFRSTVSFGSIKSSASLPCQMSHASVPPALADRMAPPAGLLRISVGIEEFDDLVEDLERALESLVA